MAMGRNSSVRQAAASVFSGRRIATAIALLLALGFGWHAFFGQNGITAYAQKRGEDRELKAQIEKLTDENTKLQDHVDHLQSDPDTIEMVARQRLHYTRSGEVIYTLNNQPAPGASQDSSRGDAAHSAATH
jgi:cell division protein FtsB